MDRQSTRQLQRLLLVAIPSLAVTTLLVGIIEDGLGVGNASAIYLIAVVASALTAGAIGGIVASIGAFLLYNFLYTEPRFTLAVDDPEVWFSVVLLLFVGIVVGQLAALQQQRTRTAEAREREAVALFRLSRALATRTSTPAVLPDVIGVLRAEARMERVWVALAEGGAAERKVADTGDGPVPVSPAITIVLVRTPGDQPARWQRVHAAVHGSEPRSGRSSADAYRARIESGGVEFGSLWALRDRGLGAPDRTQTRLLAAAADQLGQAFAHDRLAEESAAAEIARQSDALKSALLQSVSHDLRTPLATIRAAAGTLRAADLPATDREESADAVDREVDYLNRLVTNLLDLSRIEAGALRADTDVIELEDIVAPTVERVRSRAGDRPIELDLAAPPVRVDPVFLDEAVVNVLENSLRHTPAGTAIRLHARVLPERLVRLRIEDAGPGVPDAALPRLFDRFYRVPGRQPGSRSGTGIGLAVVRGLVEAMGGSVAAHAGELGGLAIDLDLPLADVPSEPVGSGAT